MCEYQKAMMGRKVLNCQVSPGTSRRAQKRVRGCLKIYDTEIFIAMSGACRVG